MDRVADHIGNLYCGHIGPRSWNKSSGGHFGMEECPKCKTEYWAGLWNVISQP